MTSRVVSGEQCHFEASAVFFFSFHNGVSESPLFIQPFQATTKNQDSDASGGHSEQQIAKILLDTQWQ